MAMCLFDFFMVSKINDKKEIIICYVWVKFGISLAKGWVKVGIRFGAVPNKNKKHIVFFYKKIKGVI